MAETAPSQDLQPQASSDYIDNSGVEVNLLYKIATKFFQANEGKAFHVSYDERHHFLALVTQAKNGPFSPEQASDVGTLDIIGKHRRKAWIELGSMSQDEAKRTFIKLLDERCQTFRPYVEAHKREQEEKVMDNQWNRVTKEKEEKAKEGEEEEAKRWAEDQQAKKLEQERIAIKKALNCQTLYHFKDYANKQYPDNIELQESLIRKLQEQHYQQYLQRLAQDADLAQMKTKSSEPKLSSEIQASNSVIEAAQSPAEVAASIITVFDEKMKLEVTKPSEELQRLEVAQIAKESRPTELSQIFKTQEEVKERERDAISETDDDNLSESDTDSYIDVDVDNFEAAQTWTKKEIVLFKKAIQDEDSENIVTVGHGEMLTVKVPTRLDGSTIMWEFATDNYDIGFGLLFQWTKHPGKVVSVHFSDSEPDDEVEDEEEVLQSNQDDPERGLVKSENTLPTSLILPIIRYNSHLEVSTGTHKYPGKGVYLLKFDNTYSFWRSKKVYYRVYYLK